MRMFVKIRADVECQLLGKVYVGSQRIVYLFQMLFMKLVKKLNRNCTDPNWYRFKGIGP